MILPSDKHEACILGRENALVTQWKIVTWNELSQSFIMKVLRAIPEKFYFLSFRQVMFYD